MIGETVGLGLLWFNIKTKAQNLVINFSGGRLLYYIQSLFNNVLRAFVLKC